MSPRVLAALVIALLIGAPVVCAEASAVLEDGVIGAHRVPARISVAAYRDGRFVPELTDLIALGLAQEDDVEVLERRHIELVFDEWSRQAFSGRIESHLRLGKLFGADYFVWVSCDSSSEARVALQLIDVGTGRLIHAAATRIPADDPADITAFVNGEVRRSVDMARSESPAPLQAIAFTRPLIEPASPEADAKAQQLLTALMQSANQQGLTVLHRQEIEPIIVEDLWKEQGFLESPERLDALAGAHWLVSSRRLKTPEDALLSVIVLDTSTGQRSGQREFALEDGTPMDTLAASVIAWIDEIIGHRPQATGASPPYGTPTGSFQPETLEPFYRGILLYNQGKYFEALTPFEESHQRDPRFLEPLRWMQASYRASGFQELADSIERYIQVHKAYPWMGIHDPKLVHAPPGVNFLGVTAETGIPRELQTAVSVLLVNALHEATNQPVFLSEDLSHLRSEYDVLVGLDHVRGVTWQVAPCLLFAKTVTAHLHRADTGYHLELRTVQQLQPHAQEQVVIVLTGGQAGWRTVIAEAIRQTHTPRRIAEDPAPLIAEGREELLRQLESGFRMDLYLKLLALDPTNVESLRRSSEEPGSSEIGGWVNVGLHRWFLRVLPHGHVLRPWHELNYVMQFCAPLHSPVDASHCPDYIAELKRIAEQYPAHPAGQLARYNAILYELDRWDYGKAKTQIDRITEALAREPRNVVPEKILQQMRSWSLALGVALGDDVPEMTQWELAGPIQPRWGSEWLPLISVWSGNDPIWFNLQPPSTREQWRADLLVRLALHPALLRQDDYSLARVEGLLRQYPQSDVALSYAALFLVGLQQHQQDMKSLAGLRGVDYVPLYERFTDVLCSRLQATAWSFTAEEFMSMIRSVMSPYTYLWEELQRERRIQETRGKLRRVVLGVIHDRETHKLTDIEVIYLIKALDRWPPERDPEREAVFRRVAEHTWLKLPDSSEVWWQYTDWLRPLVSKEELARKYYLPYVKKLRELGQDQPRTWDTMELYVLFALDLFHGKEFMAAQELYEDMLTWDVDVADDAHHTVLQIRANALFVLALIEHRNGNIPRALRLAQQALEASEGHDFWLLSNPRSGSANNRTLKLSVLELIETLRRNPKAPFRSPFDEGP